MACQQIQIERPLYEHEVLRREYNYKKSKKLNSESSSCSCNPAVLKKVVKSTIPILEWLPKYKWKQEFLKDVIAGMTVAVMHIPQGNSLRASNVFEREFQVGQFLGIAYGILGNLPPIVGIYTAFFPVLVYFLFGTSRHISMGTFAVVCLMTGKAVVEYSDPPVSLAMSAGSLNNTTVDVMKISYTPIQVATAVTFCVGVFQLLFCLFRLGFVAALLSDTLVSGFTTASAVLVLTSQVKEILGLKLPVHKGYFELIDTYRHIFNQLGDTNLTVLLISVITMTVNVINNEIIKPKFAKVSPFPIPIEIILIIFGSAASYFWNFHEAYNVSIISTIPTGLPEPTLPTMSLIGSVLVESFTICIVGYSVSISMGLIFAQKMNYDIDANQELLALGAGNIVGSFFSCMPFAASLSRSSIQFSVGGKTQITSIISCGILLIILFFIGPYFATLPKCVLASIIIVALKGMIMQLKDFFKFIKLSKLDGAVWLVTFLTTVIVGIDLGLLFGVITSLLTLMIMEFKPYVCLLGNIPHTDLYLDINKYNSAKEIPGLKLFHYNGGLNFALRNVFKSELFKLIKINTLKELTYRNNLKKIEELVEKFGKTDETKRKYDKILSKINKDLKVIILDFSSLSYIDPSGVTSLKTFADSFQKIDIPVYTAGLSEPNYEMMDKCGLFLQTEIRNFAKIHDAVLYAAEAFGLKSSGDIEKIFSAV